MGDIDWGYVKQITVDFVTRHQDKAIDTVWSLLQTILIIILSYIVIRVGSKAIKRFFDRQKESKYTYMDPKRTDTLKAISISILRYSVYFITIITIMEILFNVRPTTIVAAAGVGGLAIGFGAQSLVKDVITGFFILLENQFSVGDMVTIGDMTGTVEEIGLRITKMRSFTGDLYIIPNSEISKVTNNSAGHRAIIVDVTVAYEENTDKVIEVLNKVCKQAKLDFDSIVEGPDVLGVIKLGETGVVMRVFAKAVAGTQWGTERELRKRIKDAFVEQGVEIPYNRVVLMDQKSRGKY